MKRLGYVLFRAFPLIKRYFFIYWNRFFFSVIGVRYGRNLIITNKVYVRGLGGINIGESFLMSSGGAINPISRNIYSCFYVALPSSKIEIGNNVGMSSTCLWAQELIHIGNNVNIGANTLILDNDSHSHHYVLRRRGQSQNQNIPTKPIYIEDDVWIGAECIILKGVHIGARSIIAAGSVVTKCIPSDVMAGGNPCVVIKHL